MFVLEEFRELIDLDDMHDYASKNLNLLYDWGNKINYELDGERVLKIASNDNGLSINSIECRLYSNYASEETFPENILTRVFEKDTMSSWIITERCESITSGEFKDILQIEFEKFSMFLRGFPIDDFSLPKQGSKIIDFLNKIEIEPGSMFDLEYWGKKDSKLKLMEVGGIKNKFHKRKRKYLSENPKIIYSFFEF